MEIKYKSFYGEEFNTKEECEKAEKARRTKTFYVEIFSRPDLTETGRMMQKDVFRVFSPSVEKDICVFAIIQKMNISLIGVSVMGHGYQEHCFYRFIEESEFQNPSPIMWGGSPLRFGKFDVVVGKELAITELK